LSKIARAPRWAKATVAVGLTFTLLLTAVSAGIRLPGLSMLLPFRFPAGLDYSGPLGSFSPLRPAFVRSVLGDLIPAEPRSPEGRRGPGGTSAVLSQRLEETHPATNDRRQDARSIPSIPYRGHTNTRNASRDPDEPAGCAPVGGTVWYRYDANRTAALIATTFGTNYATSLAVFVSDEDGPRQIGCDTDPRGNAYWPFTAEEGKTYLIQVASATGGGDLIFNLEPQGRTAIVSTSRSGRPGYGNSFFPTLSPDGRHVAFISGAPDLAAGAKKNEETALDMAPVLRGCFSEETEPELYCQQIVFRDRRVGDTRVASVSSEGYIGNSSSWGPTMSADGRYVAFTSESSNLVPGDTNEDMDAFVHDFRSGKTERVSVADDGTQSDTNFANTGASRSSISGDGRYVAFESEFESLVPGDTNGSADAFVRDRLLSRTTRVSVSSSGEQTFPLVDQVYAGRLDGAKSLNVMEPSISSNGRFVAFNSSAANLVGRDTNNALDVFVHDRQSHRTERVSVDSRGKEGNGSSSISGRSSISADGRYVVFSSAASNLVAGDTNGVGDVFVHDRKTRKTIRASVSTTGEQIRDQTFLGYETISLDGGRIGFQSDASNLVPRDENASLDVFVHDLRTKVTIRVSVEPGGTEATGRDGGFPWLSADGNTVAFDSYPKVARAGPGDREFDQVYVHEMPRP
jgi:Tol biopolymer transport system component